jgi:pathogenesis-related protein 1
MLKQTLSSLVATLLLSSACASSDSAKTSTPGPMPTDPEILEILAAHNAARAAVTPAPGTALVPLQWSDEAAAVARDYASKCIFTHNGSRSDLGENLYASSGGASGTKVVEGWVSEKKDYNYASNTCSGTSVCGHYTQVIWGATTHVGCAKQACTTGSPLKGSATWEMWVCNYSPPGNYVGRKPY